MRSPQLSLILLVAISPASVAMAAPLQTSSQYTQVVVRAPVALALVASPTTVGIGQPISMIATIAGRPGYPVTGSILFFVVPSGSQSTATSGTPLLSSSAVITPGGTTASWTTTLPSGIYQASASYSGDINYLPQTVSGTAAITVAPGDFELAVTGTKDVRQGQSLAATLSVSPINGWNGIISISCANADPNFNCQLSEPSMNIPAGSSIPTPLAFVIKTFPTTVSAMAGFLFLLVGVRHLRHRSLSVKAILAAGLTFAFMTGCGITHYVQRNGTALGTHSVIIVATSGTITHSQNFTFHVTSQ